MKNNSNLKKKKSKRLKALSFKPTDGVNKDINKKNKENKKEDENLPKKDKIIFMNEEENEGYCVNRYDNGDAYFGYYANNLRNHHGFYFYNPIYENNYKINRYYFGLWKNDLRHGYGIYLWTKEEGKEKFYENFDNSNFKAYVGNFDSDNLDKGTYLSKEGDNYFIYHGTFSKDRKRDGNNCFYFSSNLEILLYGMFKENEFVDGYFASFYDDGDIKEIFKYNNNKADNLESNNENNNIKEMMNTFRDCIMSEDYFGIIFDVFSRILKFKERYLFNIDVINTYKNEDFLDICKSYKKIKIYQDIEKYVVKK